MEFIECKNQTPVVCPGTKYCFTHLRAIAMGRRRIKEMCTFFSKTIVKRTQPGQRQSVQHEGEINCHHGACGMELKNCC